MNKLKFELSADKKTIRTSFNLDSAISKPKRMSLIASEEFPNIQEDIRKDLIPYRWRILSASYLPDVFIDYSDPNLLKPIVDQGLAENATLMIDHSRSVKNWVGIVGKSEWEDATDTSPAGVNAIFWIDQVKSKEYELIRGIEIGSIHSASVSIEFEWKKSHPTLNDDQFFKRLGEIVNNDIVRIIPIKIYRILEVSIVWQGADPDAKIKPSENNNTIIGTASLSHEGGYFMKAILAKILGLPESEVTPETLPNLIQEFSKKEVGNAIADKETQIVGLEKKTSELEAKVKDLEAKATQSLPMFKAGEEYLAELRKDTEKIYRLALGDKADTAVVGTIQQSSDCNQLKTIKALYHPIVEKQMGELKCTQCGSTSITRQQSTENSPDPDPGTHEAKQEMKQIEQYVTGLFEPKKSQ